MANSNYFWTEDQLNRLRESYANNGGLRTAAEKIPEKTMGTIAAKASRMGLTTAKPRRRGEGLLGSISESNSDSSPGFKLGG